MIKRVIKNSTRAKKGISTMKNSVLALTLATVTLTSATIQTAQAIIVDVGPTAALWPATGVEPAITVDYEVFQLSSHGLYYYAYQVYDPSHLDPVANITALFNTVSIPASVLSTATLTGYLGSSRIIPSLTPISPNTPSGTVFTSIFGGITWNAGGGNPIALGGDSQIFG